MKSFILIIASLIVAFSSFAFSQTTRVCPKVDPSRKPAWEVFSPESKGFQVELPETPCHLEISGSVDIFSKSSQLIKPCQYAIWVEPPREEQRTVQEDGKIISVSFVKKDGYREMDLVYEANAKSDACKIRQIRRIDTKSHTYFLSFSATSVDDLKLEFPVRFFESFKIL